MCKPTCMVCWPACSAWRLAVGLGIATALILNEVIRPSPSKTLSSPLLKLHVSTLRLKPDAGKELRYEMLGAKPKLVRLK